MHRTTALSLTALLLSAGLAHAKSPLDGRIQVHNARHTPVTVTVDRDLTLRLAPGERRLVADVPNGLRYVEIHDRHGPPSQQRLAVPVQGTARLQIEALLGTVSVLNDSGARLSVQLDGRPLGTAAPGQRLLADDLRPGSYQLVARAPGGGPAQLARTVRVTAGETSAVRLGPWHAQLTVNSPLTESATLYVDGRREGTLRPRGSQQLSRLDPGLRILELRDRRGDVLAIARVDLSPGERQRVTLSPQRPELHVHNDRRERVEVVINGVPRGPLRPGERRVYTDLRPGTHRVSVVGADGRAAQHQVRLAPGEREVLALRPTGRDRGYVARR